MALTLFVLHAVTQTIMLMSAGMRLIQLLPVNDTSVHRMWWDSYPYSSISVRLPCSATRCQGMP